MPIKVKKITTKKSVFNFEDLHIECGILKDSVHYQPNHNKQRSLGSTRVNAKSSKKSELSTLEIMTKMDKKFGILAKPKVLQPQKFIDNIMQFLIGDWLFNNTKSNVVLNGWRAFFRQPMIEGKYKNTELTAKNKGFNKGAIDSGQLFNSINSVIIKDGKTWGLK